VDQSASPGWIATNTQRIVLRATSRIGSWASGFRMLSLRNGQNAESVNARYHILILRSEVEVHRPEEAYLPR
jgi:hypothetical protein